MYRVTNYKSAVLNTVCTNVLLGVLHQGVVLYCFSNDYRLAYHRYLKYFNIVCLMSNRNYHKEHFNL